MVSANGTGPLEPDRMIIRVRDLVMRKHVLRLGSPAVSLIGCGSNDLFPDLFT